jgi:hypothetical protein
MFDPRTKSVFVDEDGAAFDAKPTLIGLQEVIDDALQANELSAAFVFSWALVAHALNGTLTPPVLRAWLNTAYNSSWFNHKEALRRIRYEIFELPEKLKGRVS